MNPFIGVSSNYLGSVEQQCVKLTVVCAGMLGESKKGKGDLLWNGQQGLPVRTMLKLILAGWKGVNMQREGRPELSRPRDQPGCCRSDSLQPR